MRQPAKPQDYPAKERGIDNRGMQDLLHDDPAGSDTSEFVDHAGQVPFMRENCDFSDGPVDAYPSSPQRDDSHDNSRTGHLPAPGLLVIATPIERDSERST